MGSLSINLDLSLNKIINDISLEIHKITVRQRQATEEVHLTGRSSLVRTPFFWTVTGVSGVSGAACHVAT